MTLEDLQIASSVLYTFFKMLRISFRHTSDTPLPDQYNLSHHRLKFEAILSGENL